MHIKRTYCSSTRLTVDLIGFPLQQGQVEHSTDQCPDKVAQLQHTHLFACPLPRCCSVTNANELNLPAAPVRLFTARSKKLSLASLLLLHEQ